MRSIPVVAALVVSLGPSVPALAQQPPVQNGRVETRQAADLAREVQAIGASATEPVWVGWRAPMVGGPRSLCNWYVDDQMSVRGFLASTGVAGEPGVPRIAPPTGPVPIEAGTGLVILIRLAGGQVERMRTLTDDCPIDAGGRTIYWFDGVTAARSIAYLDSLTRLEGLDRLDRPVASARRSVARSAVTAIALHADAAAMPVLDRLASLGTEGTDTSLRRHAASQIGQYRGADGFQTLGRLLAAEQDPAVRRALVLAIAQTGQSAAAELLAGLAERDADARLRADAVAQYARLAGEAGLTRILAIIERDEAASVRHRAVQALGTIPGAAGVPHLITLARSHTDSGVRKEAVTALGQTKDPRAVAYLTELLTRRQ